MSPALPLILSGLVGGGSLFSWATFAPTSRLWGANISRGSRANPQRVALTFDDGPTPGGTDRILDVLHELKVPATFFAIGQNVQRHPDLLRRIDAEGHLIGNHTFDHSHWGIFTPASWWLEQVIRTDDQIEKTIGRRTTFFRPPVGHKTPLTGAALRRSGHTMVTWTLRCYDGLSRTTPQDILGRLLPRARAGDIVLLHDGSEPHFARHPGATVEALRPLIQGLRERELEPVRLDSIVN